MTPSASSRHGVVRPLGAPGPVALIVDDSLTIRMDLAAAFEAAGFVARLCATAAEARAALRAEVSVVVLDVLLPDADGVELLQELRADPATAAIPILMLSIEAEVEHRVRGMQTGADDYVGKPYDTHHVVARATELVRARETAAPDRPTVLIIDDSPTFLDHLYRTLEHSGYAVVAAATGEDGLRLAAMHRPAALIVDGQMPGVDGPTVIRRIRLDAALRGLPCMMLTGADASVAELQALDAGADAFVRKDGDLELVIARLAAMLRHANRALDEVAPLLSPKRILVVDDNELYLEAIATALRSDGYDVVLARSGEAALQVLAAQVMDCVLLDRAMPGLGGMETCRQLKASSALRELPVIMLSANADRHATIDALAAGADDHIVKSEEIGVLKARIHARIRRKQLEDDHRRRREELLRSELHAAAAQAARHEAEAKSALARELERRNQELEAFAYSVSHDLRSPLRSIGAFSLALIEDHAEPLGDIGRGYLAQIRGSARRMGQLIDDLMALSRISRTQVHRQSVNLSEVAHTVAAELVQTAPTRKVAFEVERQLFADADRGLVRLLLENLLENAWKFTGKRPDARIEFGAAEDGGERVYFVQDNGAGFDQASATRLFQPFTRLHTEEEFSGTGIGLATVRRIVERHGGRVWAEGAAGLGARFFFTLVRESTR